MSIYIASALHHRNTAQDLVERLSKLGADITSTWHLEHPTAELEAVMLEEKQKELAHQCCKEIDKSVALIWLYGKLDARVGSAWECGYAYCSGLFVLSAPVEPGLKSPTIFTRLLRNYPSIEDLLLAEFG